MSSIPSIRSPTGRSPPPACTHSCGCRGAAQQRHPDGRARLFPAGDRRRAGQQRRPVKAALHRGRERLREYAEEPADRPLPVMTDRSARCSAPISTASTPATSTPCATCWPTKCGSILSPGPGCKGARPSVPTSTTTLTANDWRFVLGSSTGAPPRSLRSRPSGGKAAVFRPARLGGRPAADDPGFPLCPLCGRGCGDRRPRLAASLLPPAQAAEASCPSAGKKQTVPGSLYLTARHGIWPIGECCMRGRRRRAAYPA